MEDRNRVLVNAPMSLTPRTELEGARDIRKALNRNLQGYNYGVYCHLLGDTFRVYDARTRRGVLEVRIGVGEWVLPGSVYVEG